MYLSKDRCKYTLSLQVITHKEVDKRLIEHEKQPFSVYTAKFSAERANEDDFQNRVRVFSNRFLHEFAIREYASWVEHSTGVPGRARYAIIHDMVQSNLQIEDTLGATLLYPFRRLSCSRRFSLLLIIQVVASTGIYPCSFSLPLIPYCRLYGEKLRLEVLH